MKWSSAKGWWSDLRLHSVTIEWVTIFYQPDDLLWETKWTWIGRQHVITRDGHLPRYGWIFLQFFAFLKKKKLSSHYGIFILSLLQHNRRHFHGWNLSVCDLCLPSNFQINQKQGLFPYQPDDLLFGGKLAVNMKWRKRGYERGIIMSVWKRAILRH